MTRYTKILLLFALLIAGCTGKRPAPITPHPHRDTTIVAANALTRLVLDSLQVQKFLDSVVRDSAVAASIINFYNSRNYQYALFNEEGLTESAEAFRLLNELNIPLEDRIKQMIINLQRMKWMPVEDTTYILANIPEFRLRVYRRDTVELAMRIVVGKAATIP